MTQSGGGVRVVGADGPVVVLLPGGVAGCDGFFPGLVDGLVADPGCRIVVHDRPGTGASNVPGSLAAAPRHLADVVREVGGGPAVLVGQSLGGAVALLTAVEEPDVVAGLVLLDPTPVTDPRVCAGLERRLRLLGAVAGVRRAAGGPGPDELRRLAAAVRGLTRVSRRVVRGPLPPVPAVVVTADRPEDDPTALALARLAAGLGAPLVTWPGAGHDVHTEDPERVLAEVRALLARTHPTP